MHETPLAGNLLVILIGVLSLVPLVVIIVFLAIRLSRGGNRSDKGSREESGRPPDGDR